MLVILYGTSEFCEHVSDIDTGMIGTGYMGVMGNKVRLSSDCVHQVGLSRSFSSCIRAQWLCDSSSEAMASLGLAGHSALLIPI